MKEHMKDSLHSIDTIFNDFGLEESKRFYFELTIGKSQVIKRSCVISRSLIGGILVERFGLKEVRHQVNLIKKLLQDETELIWLYGLALCDFLQKPKLDNEIKNRQHFQKELRNHNKKKQSRASSKNVWDEFEEIKNRSQANSTYASKAILEELVYVRKGMYGKDYSRSHSPMLRIIVVKAVESLSKNQCPEYDNTDYSLTRQERHRVIEQWIEKRKATQAPEFVIEACRQVYTHLKAFGIDLKKKRVVQDIYYDHRKGLLIAEPLAICELRNE